jgi:A/G-specific adenine glycosylase
VPAPRARVAALRRRLLAWWDAGHRALPWRTAQRAADPYRVWVAEVMLQQTQVATAIPYYLRFLERFPSMEALAAARDEDVLSAWSGLGYYARCRNLVAAAREALRRHGGLPASLEALRELPGFGPYTAGAVASIAFAIPAPAVDGNVVRVLSRLFLVAGDPAARPARARVEALAGALVDPFRPGDLNQALMELGATVCAPTRPACARCPLSPLCQARAKGRTAELPARRRRPARLRRLLACAVVERAGRVLLVRSPQGGLFAGLAAFPAAELPDGARAAPALARQARARHGLSLRTGPELARVERVLTHRVLELRAYRCRLEGAPLASGAEWVMAGAIGGAGLPAAMRALWEAVRAAAADSA